MLRTRLAHGNSVGQTYRYDPAIPRGCDGPHVIDPGAYEVPSHARPTPRLRTRIHRGDPIAAIFRTSRPIPLTGRSVARDRGPCEKQGADSPKSAPCVIARSGSVPRTTARNRITPHRTHEVSPWTV